MSWLTLKSGSDVRGTAIGDGTVLTCDVARSLGMAFVGMMSERTGIPASEITISLGRDSRVTGEALLAAAGDGVTRAGAKALDFGMCTTPAMYMSTITPGFEPEGAIMITASHHPWNKNGLKFFTREGGLEGKDVEALLTAAEGIQPEAHAPTGTIEPKAFLPVYAEQLAERIRSGLGTREEKPLKGLHVAVDAGNGAGGFYASLMEQLGAKTEGSQFLNPDGMFPNHIPNPENADAMAAIQKAVLTSHADLGVIFDTDCDRAAVVDADGKEINRNRLIALISAILLEGKPGQTTVTDSVTSAGLKTFIESRGGEHYRFKRGYRNVIDEAIRLNKEGKDCPLAIETSGHAAMRENHFLDDGMYLVTVLIVQAMKMKKQGKTLGSVIANLKEPAEAAEIRMGITAEDFRSAGQAAIQRVIDAAEKKPGWEIAPDNREGIRIQFDDQGVHGAGWFLLRLSVHDPVMPLNVESDTAGGVRTAAAELYEVLKDCAGIDTAPLKRYI